MSESSGAGEPSRLLLAWRRIAVAITAWWTAPVVEQLITLKSLRPEYDATAHSTYVDLLMRHLLETEPPRNVALAGPYGSGKSSILKELRERWKPQPVVEIALATVDGDASAIVGSSADTKSGSVVTEALQKEIVKRLLYASDSATLPRSQLNRIKSFPIKRGLLVSAFGAALFSLVSWIYEIPLPFKLWHQTWDPKVISPDWAQAASLLLDGALIFAAFIAVQWTLSAVRVREVGVGEFRLAREDSSQNYFDQYLDEIVYFFSRTRTTLVIFEDLDRFHQPGIFVALRELNVLLNNSAAVPAPVTFVYAVGDRVFAPNVRPKGVEGVASAAAARAKFFDLIVPVVPFVSTEVSGGLLTNELSFLAPEERPDADLIRLVGSQFPDMRVIRSLRNEYVIYLDRLIRRGALELDKDRLFAMVVYKHVFPDDYEKIQFGSSKLDQLVAAVERGASARLAGLDHEIRSEQSAAADGAAQSERAKQAGERAMRVFALFAKAPGRGSGIASVEIGGVEFTPDDVGAVEFWRTLDANPTDAPKIRFASGSVVSVPRSPLNEALPADLPASTWISEAVTASQGRLQRLVTARRDLAHSNLREKLTDPRFIGFGVSKKNQATEIDLGDIARRHLRDPFALELVSSGRIDESFALYTSVYDDSSVSAAAQNFRILFANRRLSSPGFALTVGDIRDLRSKIGDAFLEEPSVLNVSIFDALLAGGDLDSAVQMIARGVLDENREFVDLYISRGSRVPEFARKLAATAPWVLTSVASSGLGEREKSRAFVTALYGLDGSREYQMNDDSKQLLATAARVSFKGAGRDFDRSAATAVAKLLAESGLKAPLLVRLSAPARRAFAEYGTFEINRSNLAAIAGNRGRIGLDSIARRSPEAVRQVLVRLAEYLDLLDLESARSIDGSPTLIPLVEQVALIGRRELLAVLKRAEPGVSIGDLRKLEIDDPAVLAETLRVLAETNFFSPTAANLSRYLDVVGSVDRSLARMLASAPTVLDPDSLDERGRSDVANAIAVAKRIPAASVLRLVAGIAPGPLDMRGLVLERIDVTELLLKHGWISDDAGTFSTLLKGPWPVAEAAIAASEGIADFVADIALTTRDFELILESPLVGGDVKEAILTSPSQVARIDSPRGAGAALRQATASHLKFSEAELQRLVDASREAEIVLDYLASEGDQLSDPEIEAALRALGTPWSSLVDGTSRWKILPASPQLERVLERLKKMGFVARTSRARDDGIRVTLA